MNIYLFILIIFLAAYPYCAEKEADQSLLPALFVSSEPSPLYVEIPLPSADEALEYNKKVAEYKSFPLKEVILSIFIVLLAIAGYIFAVALWQRRFSPTPPSLVALKKARKILSRSDRNSKEVSVQFWLCLSNSIRCYLYEYYGLQASSLTSEECLALLEKQIIDYKEEATIAEKILFLADKAKYGGIFQPFEECLQAVREVNKLLLLKKSSLHR